MRFTAGIFQGLSAMRLRIIWFFVLVTVFDTRTYAYKQPTHEDMSEAAAFKSILVDSNFLGTLGLKFSIDDERQRFTNSVGTPKTIKFLIRDGARFEDGVNCGDTRSENHFYDPIFNNGLIWNTQVVTPLISFPITITGQKSPDWALEDQSQFFAQDYSLRDARQYLYEALTLPNLDSRNRKFGLTFQALGQVIHHLQDMAQPQHVRNDPHYIAPGQDCSQIVQTLGGYLKENPSRYEKYTDANRSDIIGSALQNNPYDPVYPGTDPTIFNTARKFWVTQEGTGGTGLGISEFTNNNFVSAGTNFALINGQAAPGSRYPLPQPGAPNSVPVSQLFAQKGQPVPASIQAACGQGGGDCVMTFYSTRVRDFYTNKFVDNPRGSTLSLFDQDLRANNQIGCFNKYTDGKHIRTALPTDNQSTERST